MSVETQSEGASEGGDTWPPAGEPGAVDRRLLRTSLLGLRPLDALAREELVLAVAGAQLFISRWSALVAASSGQAVVARTALAYRAVLHPFAEWLDSEVALTSWEPATAIAIAHLDEPLHRAAVRSLRTPVFRSNRSQVERWHRAFVDRAVRDRQHRPNGQWRHIDASAVASLKAQLASRPVQLSEARELRADCSSLAVQAGRRHSR